MIIGIDIDDTVAKTNISLMDEALKYDKEHVQGRGYKNKDAYTLTDCFYWTEDVAMRFMAYVRDSNLFTEITPIDGAVEYINKLYDFGYKIYFITRRKNTAHMLKVTMKWLDKYGFKYHKLLMGIDEKGSVCKEELVDLFIDNDLKHIREVSEKNIDTLLMTDDFNQEDTEFRRVTTWEEVYDYVVR